MSFGPRSAKDSLRPVQDEKHNLPYSREVLFSPSSTDLPRLGGIEVGAHPVFQAARLSGWPLRSDFLIANQTGAGRSTGAST
jgi:hypothetical protein